VSILTIWKIFPNFIDNFCPRYLGIVFLSTFLLPSKLLSMHHQHQWPSFCIVLFACHRVEEGFVSPKVSWCDDVYARFSLLSLSENGRSRVQDHDHFQCLHLEMFLFWQCWHLTRSGFNQDVVDLVVVFSIWMVPRLFPCFFVNTKGICQNYNTSVTVLTVSALMTNRKRGPCTGRRPSRYIRINSCVYHVVCLGQMKLSDAHLLSKPDPADFFQISGSLWSQTRSC